MTKRTREQKIIADLRKQLRLREGVLKTEDKPKVSLKTSPQFSLPYAPVISASPPEAVNYSYLKKDLLKVGIVVTIALTLEIIGTYLISQGAFKSLGVS